jgi:tetratricopeptide (TPR) repeat protein
MREILYKYMFINRIVGPLLVILFVTTLYSGCIGNTPEKKTCINCTSPIQTLTADAVKFFDKGSDAYINHDYSMALDFYNKSLEADPAYTKAWIAKGNVLIRMNRTSDAISAYDSALTIRNDLPEVWYSKGEALMTLGRYREASDSFEKVLILVPDYPLAKENRDLALAKQK